MPIVYKIIIGSVIVTPILEIMLQMYFSLKKQNRILLISIISYLLPIFIVGKFNFYKWIFLPISLLVILGVLTNNYKSKKYKIFVPATFAIFFLIFGINPLSINLGFPFF